MAKPGPIDAPGREAVPSVATQPMFNTLGHHPAVHVSELAAAMIDQCLHGIVKDPLWSEDLIEIGRRVLHKEDYLV